jgi:hypothetical protein
VNNATQRKFGAPVAPLPSVSDRVWAERQEQFADVVAARVRRGGVQAEMAAAMAREVASKWYSATHTHLPDGLGRVTFFVACGLNAVGEIR